MTLDLTDNRIGDGGIKAIATGIQNCHVLQKLWIKINKFSVDGVKALARSLNYSIDLRQKKLTINGMGPKGFTIAFLEVLCDDNISLWA